MKSEHLSELAPMATGGGASAEARPNGIVHATLENDLGVLIIPDHRAPVVTHMVWYKNGSADDPVGKSGIAHFLEHLMFKGTRKHPAGAFMTTIAELGGQQNAFTSNDFTAYFQQIAAEHLPTCMEYESDRMKNLVLTEEMVSSERKVVLEERLMRTESKPGQILAEALQAALFTTHPYGKPVIGWQEEIRGLVREDALDYYQRFYTPENALLVVAGDVEPEAAIDLARRHYGNLQRSGAPPVRRRPGEPKPTTQRQVSLADAKVGQQQFLRAHLVPSYGNGGPREAEAFTVLGLLLGRAQTGVLYRRLVLKEDIASSVAANYVGTARDQSRFALSASAKPGIALERLDDAIEAVIREHSANGFEPADIERAKKRLMASALYARDSQMSLSQWYGRSMCIGMTLEAIEAWPERIAAVTAEDLLRALRSLDRATCVSGRLLQSDTGGAAAVAA
jgi:zinc protease